MELFIITVKLSFVTYLFIMLMINVILTSTDTQSTTFHISTLWEDWLHETSITPLLILLKCLWQARKVNGHIFVFGIWILPVSIIFFDRTLELFSYDNNIVKPYQSSQSEKPQEKLLYNSALIIFSHHLSYASSSNFTIHAYFY